MKSQVAAVLVVVLIIVVGIAVTSAHWSKASVNASAPQPCKAALNEQCPSDKFSADYSDWKAKHEEIAKLMKSDGHVSELTRLDHEWKGMRDDLTQEAQQECPGCTFDDKTMKFTKPQPAPAK